MGEYWLATILQLSIFVFGIGSCYIPIPNQIRFGWKKTLLLWSFILSTFLFLGSLLHVQLGISLALIEWIAVVLFFFVFRFTVTLDLSRVLAIYIGIVAIESFTFHFGWAYDALYYPDLTPSDLSLEGSWIQALSSFILVVGFFYPAFHYFSKALDLLSGSKIWNSTTIISLTFFLSNLLIRPISYQNLTLGRLRYIYPFLEGAFLLSLITIYTLYYYAAWNMVKNYELNKKKEILEIETKHIQELQDYIRQSAKLRHDFRHSVRLLSILAHKGDFETLKEYLANYEKQLETTAPIQYCQNAAINALLGYYQEMAKEAHIQIKWHIELPDPLPFSELDMASLFGNLIENAIQGCQNVPQEKRYFYLTSEIPHPGQLYIVSTNSFNGVVYQTGSKYESTKPKGHGIGLSSIEATVEKYGGHVTITHDQKEFDVDILLPY